MKSSILRAAVIAGCLLSAATTGISTAHAGSYPDKPLKLVVGFPPGGPTDIIGRIIGRALADNLGQPVVVENKGGAGGTIASRSVATSDADGYTLLVSVESSQTRGAALNKTLPYDPVNDFTFIGKLAKQTNLLVVNPKLPVNNVKELIDYAKSHPGELNYSGTYGATSHLGGALFDINNQTKMTFISYPGGAQPITDLIGGVVQVGFFSEATVAQHVKSGTLKALAVAAKEPSEMFPDLPTLQQAGAAPMDISPWFGLVAPDGIPKEALDRLSQAVSEITKSSSFNQQLKNIGASAILNSTPKSFHSDVQNEIAYWKKLVADANLTVN
ncbi:MAG: Bug family tripartite tricarboxylate transporter substrate binding protein [Burkholderiaceae bacterium]